MLGGSCVNDAVCNTVNVRDGLIRNSVRIG